MWSVLMKSFSCLGFVMTGSNMFYTVQSSVCKQGHDKDSSTVSWKLSFRWDIVKFGSFKKVCKHVGLRSLVCLFDLLMPSRLAVLQLQPPPPSLPVAPASSPVPPHLLWRLKASLYSQPTSRARFTDHSTATDSNSFKKKVHIKEEMARQRFKR